MCLRHMKSSILSTCGELSCFLCNPLDTLPTVAFVTDEMFLSCSNKAGTGGKMLVTFFAVLMFLRDMGRSGHKLSKYRATDIRRLVVRWWLTLSRLD